MGSFAGAVQLVHAGGESFGAGAKLRGELDLGSTAGLTVKESAIADLATKHFFETEGLGAELNFVAGIAFGFATFVFDGEGSPQTGEVGERDTVGGFVEFDDVGLTGEAELKGVEAEAAGGADTWATFGTWGVGAFVEDAPFGSETIFLPQLFDVDKPPLPLTEEEVLEAREWEEVIFVVHLSSWRNYPGEFYSVGQRVWCFDFIIGKRPWNLRAFHLERIEQLM